MELQRVKVPNALNAHLPYRYAEDPYLVKPFVAWDGEGVNLPDGSHAYTLMVNSMGHHVAGTARKPLTTAQCVRFLLDGVKLAPPNAIHVIYGGSYDTNMILGGLSPEEIRRVYTQEFADVRGLRIGYRQGKSLYVRDSKGTAIKLYDVISFFQCSFINACDQYLGNDWPDRERIVRMKAARGEFTDEEAEDILRYSFSEVATLVRLMDELRMRLFRAGLKVTRWDGPGSVASSLLAARGVKHHQDKNVPREVAKASRHAYAGGRFELIKCGHVEEKVYEYDINSAYPFALSTVPTLSSGEWSYVQGDPGDLPFAVYRIRWGTDGNNLHLPERLFLRGSDGSVWYPWQGSGWYWSPEVRVARAYAERERRMGNSLFDVIEAWVWTPANDSKPFGWIPEMYEQRRRLKERGDGAHVGMKLGLNSLYGKLAQQIGWKLTPKGLRIPPYHQLEWAGYVTSFCRSMVLGASLDSLSEIIAYETDALFSRTPLPVRCGFGLGEWEQTLFSSLTYVQSGFYFGTLADSGESVSRFRGFDPGTVTRDDVLRALTVGRRLTTSSTRFVGMGSALATSFERWRKWEHQERTLTPQPTGKRIHAQPCDSCGERGEFTLGVWHDTYCPMAFMEQESREYPIGWINPDPNMQELEELRKDGYGQWESLG